MKCSVCSKELGHAHLIYCARCAVYVHEKCWQKHVAQSHQEQT